MGLSKDSWNPNTDGRPNEKYRTYKNRKVSIFSSRDGKEWFFAIENTEFEDKYDTEAKAMDAAQAYLDEHEYYKGWI